MTELTLSRPDMILIAFYRVSKGSTARIPYEELVLQAWRDFPEAFSLRNHPEHPDASDIHKRIYGTLKRAGYVVSLRNKMFRLTDKGIAAAEKLISDLERPTETSQPESKLRLRRDEQRFVEHAMKTDAFRVWLNGDKDRLVDYDARLFFQFSTGTALDERKNKVRFALDALEEAAKIGVPSSNQLLEFARYLSEAFSHLMEGA